MSSPFSWFRRKQKILLAVFGILIIISFTVGGIVTSYQQQHMGSGGGTDVVVSWKRGKISENELATMRYNHTLVVRFLDRIVQETFARKGWPKAPGVTRDQFGQIVPGIPRSSREEDLVRTILLAQKASDMGMVVTKDAIWEFLHLLSDDKLRRPDFGSLLEATDDQASQSWLFRQLRTELLAQNLERIIRSGLMAIPPDRAWDYFNRFNHEIEAEVFPIRVADYMDKVKGTPTDAQVKQLYEEAKDRYSDPNSPEPGFKRRKEITFQYLKVEYNRFLEQEKAAVPMEDVAKYYKENQDDFRVLELPPAEDEKPEAKPAVTPGKDGASETPDTKTDTGDPSGKEEKPIPDTTDEVSAKEKPETPPKTEPSADSVDPKKVTSELPAKTDTSEPDMDLVPPKNKPAGSEKPKPSEDARAIDPLDTLFVSFGAQPEPKDASDAAKPDAAKPEAAKPEAAKPEAAKPEATEKEKPVEYQPIEDVEDEIRKSIATPIAEEKKKKAFEAAKRKLELYFEERNVWDHMVKAKLKATEPPPLDHEALADQLNLTAGETASVDEIEIMDCELGKSFLSEGGQRFTFPQIAYADGIPLFKPDSIPSSTRNVDFLYWKFDEKDWKTEDGEDKSVPELDDIRDEVVEAWRRMEAVKLARAAGERLAKKVEGDKPLGDSLDEEQAKKVMETGRFTWMSGGAMPTGMGLPRLSSVFGVESAGADFMEAVFALKPGETGVAVNQPQSIVYVVRVAGESQDEETRRNEFMGRGSMFAFYPHMATVQEVMEDWHKDLEKEMELEWHRPPR